MIFLENEAKFKSKRLPVWLSQSWQKPSPFGWKYNDQTITQNKDKKIDFKVKKLQKLTLSFSSQTRKTFFLAR